MIETRQLTYFIRIAELEHFGQAAADLHIVQPALTRQMQKLEEELGVELFERLPRGVRLTAAGRVMLERARIVIDELGRMTAVTRLAGAGSIGFIRAAFSDGATYSGDVPAIVRKFRQSSPGVELELIPASSAAQAQMLERNEIDIGFVYWLPADQSNVRHHIINKERVLVAVAETNVLAKKKSVSLANLHDVPFVWFKRSNAPMFYDVIAGECQRAGLALNVVQEAFTESTMLSLVAADIGATFITEAARRRKPDNVVLLPVRDMEVNLRLTSIWRADDRSPALKALVKVVCEHQPTR